MKATLSLLSAALLLGLSATGASAAFQSCVGSGYDISTKVSTATDCTILLPLDGNVNDDEGLVNTNAFFGITNWVYDGKYNDMDASGGSNIDLDLFQFSGNNQNGSFTYTGPATGIDQIMMVFKDGANTNLVGYLVPAMGGDYSTPFIEPPFDFKGGADSKEISHISVYYTASSTSSTSNGGSTGTGVPEPGVLGLLGFGLLGFALLRRRQAS